ncbi:hypothetical protein BI362_04285 [Streptococcus parauberis]|uniref:hypothetical protein n=1 Tax=Streptococcus parauberis TaxID=1348 RepID=UPI0008FA61EA|nr:hypothetical protein [Streptococcus parauberis]OHY30488.1 hypothetical protein BI362_04285 [Streptococcus parauberis]PIA83079.1 hypothetical protein ADO07_01948 [Streptococcus parauberis]
MEDLYFYLINNLLYRLAFVGIVFLVFVVYGIKKKILPIWSLIVPIAAFIDTFTIIPIKRKPFFKKVGSGEILLYDSVLTPIQLSWQNNEVFKN